MRKDTQGYRSLVAYLVAALQQVIPSNSELHSYLKEHLPEYMVPNTFLSLEALPLTPNGKVNRHALPTPDDMRPKLKASYVAPRDPLEFQVARLWAEVLEIQSVGVRDNFFELGGHSLLAVHLLTQIQKQFDRNLPLVAFFQEATVEHIAGMLRQQRKLASRSLLLPIQPYGSQRPFFCVHPAGGDARCYLDLAHCLGLDQPFYGLQASGMDGEQNPATDIETMAVAYIEALRVLQHEGPYLIGGWSMGGQVAFEMARQLREEGQDIALLALFDTPTPWQLGREKDDVELLIEFFDNIPLSADSLRQLSFDQQMVFILEQAKKANKLLPGTMLPHLLRRFEIYKINLQAMRNYVPRTYPGRITLFHVDEQPAGSVLNPLDWGVVAEGGVEVCTVTGNHYNMIFMPRAQNLAEQLNVYLQKEM
jgi:thioesterase domain-containing protein/acyl carrier protein